MRKMANEDGLAWGDGIGGYKHWDFENGLRVVEEDFDADLHCFKCYNKDGDYLGRIVPSCIEDMRSCIADLDAGNDPITSGWEDGIGNACAWKGWGDALDGE